MLLHDPDRGEEWEDPFRWRYHFYKLIGHEVVPIVGPNAGLEWAEWMETANRRVANTYIGNDAWVSTVFLGLDHSFGGGPPVLFETMAFRMKERRPSMSDELACERARTWDEAVANHWQVYSTEMRHQRFGRP